MEGRKRDIEGIYATASNYIQYQNMAVMDHASNWVFGSKAISLVSIFFLSSVSYYGMIQNRLAGSAFIFLLPFLYILRLVYLQYLSLIGL